MRHSLKSVCNATFYNEFGNCDGISGFVLSDGLDLSSVLDLSVVNAKAVDNISVTLPDISVEAEACLNRLTVQVP